jgi:hypothetical protein
VEKVEVPEVPEVPLVELRVEPVKPKAVIKSNQKDDFKLSDDSEDPFNELREILEMQRGFSPRSQAYSKSNQEYSRQSGSREKTQGEKDFEKRLAEERLTYVAPELYTTLTPEGA